MMKRKHPCGDLSGQHSGLTSGATTRGPHKNPLQEPILERFKPAQDGAPLRVTCAGRGYAHFLESPHPTRKNQPRRPVNFSRNRAMGATPAMFIAHERTRGLNTPQPTPGMNSTRPWKTRGWLELLMGRSAWMGICPCCLVKRWSRLQGYGGRWGGLLESAGAPALPLACAYWARRLGLHSTSPGSDPCHNLQVTASQSRGLYLSLAQC